MEAAFSRKSHQTEGAPGIRQFHPVAEGSRPDFGSPPPLLVWPTAHLCGIRTSASKRNPPLAVFHGGLANVGRRRRGSGLYGERRKAGCRFFVKISRNRRDPESCGNSFRSPKALRPPPGALTRVAQHEYRISHMAPIYDDDEFEDDDDDSGGKSPAARRMIAATQAANQALEDAMLAALNTSRYGRWLVIAAAAATVIAAAAVVTAASAPSPTRPAKRSLTGRALLSHRAPAAPGGSVGARRKTRRRQA